MLGIEGKVLKRSTKKQIWTVVLQNCEKSAIKHSIERLIFYNDVLSKVVYTLSCTLPKYIKRFLLTPAFFEDTIRY